MSVELILIAVVIYFLYKLLRKTFSYKKNGLYEAIEIHVIAFFSLLSIPISMFSHRAIQSLLPHVLSKEILISQHHPTPLVQQQRRVRQPDGLHVRTLRKRHLPLPLDHLAPLRPRALINGSLQEVPQRHQDTRPLRVQPALSRHHRLLPYLPIGIKQNRQQLHHQQHVCADLFHNIHADHLHLLDCEDYPQEPQREGQGL